MAKAQKLDKSHTDFPLGVWTRQDGKVWYKKISGNKVTFGGVVNDPTGEQPASFAQSLYMTCRHL